MPFAELIQDRLNLHTPVAHIAREFGVDRNVIYREMQAFGLTRQLRFNTEYFNEINSQDKAYWLGFLLADGCVFKNRLTVKLAEKDLGHLKKLHDALDSSVPIHAYPVRGTVESNHTSERLTNSLHKWNCVPNKTSSLAYPNIPSNMDRHLIRGYIDGDGSVIRKNDATKTLRFCICCGSLEFLSAVVSKLPITTKIHTRTNDWGSAFIIDIGGNKKSKTLRDWLYDGALTYMDRKRDEAYKYDV